MKNFCVEASAVNFLGGLGPVLRSPFGGRPHAQKPSCFFLNNPTNPIFRCHQDLAKEDAPSVLYKLHQAAESLGQLAEALGQLAEAYSF